MKENFVAVLKFLCFVLLLPFIAALLISFYAQVLAVGQPIYLWLLYGGGIFVAVYLFLYNFKEVYEFGQNVVTKLLAFVQPIVNVAALVIPIYAIVFSVVFCLLKSMDVLGVFEPAAVMLVSFFWLMHVVLTAHQLNEAEKTMIKGGYFFGFGLALTFHVLIAVLLLAMMFHEFSLVNFVKHVSHLTVSNYQAIYKILFVSAS